MKFKKIFQKAAAVVMAAVTVFSVLPATTAFAAVGDVGTISFSHTYDGNGNAMRYNSSANINGYIAGGKGNYKYRMFVDGDTAFCLQPGVPLKTGNTLKEASSEAWNALSGSQKKAVGLALLYGYQGNRGNLSGSDDEKWLATQTLVWEFVTGCREATGSYRQTSSTVYSLHFGSHYPNSGAKKVYDQIVSLMSKHNTILSLVFYLKYEAPKDEQNFPMVMELLRAGEVHEDDDSYISPLDELFDRLEMENPDHIAVKYYKDYYSGSAKTLKSIQITLVARLEKFNLESVAALTATDELDLPSLGEKKVALFALIPDNDTSFNFLVSILYTQIFQQLFYLADHKYGGSLPVHCHFIMDEFANVSLPDDFDKILSVMRSRGVSVSIILQNLAQLKALFEKQWESIVGNCDEFLYLGGNEQSTHKYVSELLGKETIDTNTYGKSSGRSGNYSTNYQISGRELLTPDEVRMLDNRYALLFIRGERPVMDLKYDILKHPNLKLTTDGGMPPYLHGEPTQAVATLVFDSDIPKNAVTVQAVSTSYELLSEEDLEELFKI